ncbi:MAG: hypothetical protein AAF682_17325 [Planctomycetota bacterium]
MLIRTRATLAALALLLPWHAAAAHGQAGSPTAGCTNPLPVAGPQSDRILYTGAFAPGATSVTVDGTVYSLKFVGDETIEYQIDIGHPDVATGLLRVYEKTSDSYPLTTGGPGFRSVDASTKGAQLLANFCTMTGHGVGGNTVWVEYRDDFEGVHHRRHTFELVGKSLRIRLQSLDDNLDYVSNYNGFKAGPTGGTEDPRIVQMQGGLSTPLVLFQRGDEHFFYGNQLDLFWSNASDWSLHSASTVVPGFSSIAFSYSTQNRYHHLTDGKLAGTLDDTLNIIVTSKVADALVTTTTPPSPYRSPLASKTVVLFSGPTATWPAYYNQMELFESWGMDNLAAYFFSWWSESDNGDSSYYPAKDPEYYADLHAFARSNGMLLGEYTMFWKNYYDSPGFSPYDMPLDGLGVPKGTTIAETARLRHANRESRLLKEHYGSRLAFQDVLTYASPSKIAGEDSLDQNADSPWAKTMRRACIDRKRWLGSMQDVFQGPLLGEASIATQSSNMEWLWMGYCDGVQRVINTDAGKQAVELPDGHPLAPTLWPVIPEYELRVFARTQANHGNGFYERFFSWADGDVFDFDPGILTFPLPEAALDRYRAYELTYGHTSYFHSNGPIDGPGNYLRYADMIKEYYLVNALQRRYLSSPVREIRYLHDDLPKTFEEVLFETETTDSFVDPRIRIEFDNDLFLYVNHSAEDWLVVVSGTPIKIPEDGFLAFQLGSPFMAFSAIPAGAEGRFDYCFAPGEYEMFDGRGVVAGFGGVQTVDKRLAVHNFAKEILLSEDADGSVTTVAGAAPTLVGVYLALGDDTLARGERTAVQATGVYSNGAIADLTPHLAWSSSSPDTARVNGGGAVEALCPGQAQISAEDYQGVAVTPATVTVL